MEGSMTADWIRQQLAVLKQGVEETALELNRCRQDHEAFRMEFYTYKETNQRFEFLFQQHGEAHPDVIRIKATKDNLEKSTKTKYLKVTTERKLLVSRLGSSYELVRQVQEKVLDKELIKWKREQQLAGNGRPIESCLDLIQEWCEGLAEIIWALRQQVRQLDCFYENVPDPQNTPNPLQDILVGITELLSNLVTGTFIIEKQPPQVMKTNTRFTATVRLLVGGVLNVHMVAPSVNVYIVSETMANQLLVSQSNNHPKKKEDFTTGGGDILNGQGTMEFHAATKQVSVSFRNLQLKKIRRAEKKGTESVMDEKFSVLFWTEFQVGELKFQLWTLSLPVVVIVHGNQEPQALATITWDNAFAEWGRRPFVVPEKVSWSEMGKALSVKWNASCGSPLTEENLYYLACKALRNSNLAPNPDEYNDMMLSWQLFCKEPLPDRNFTFWEWFHRILILTSTHMARLWKEGHIMGFVSKQAAENCLLQKPNGTFLLRFSDSELGGITIAYVNQIDMYQKPVVVMLAPFTTKDLSQRSMADVIFDLQQHLTFLYPDLSKEVFRKFCSSSSQGQAARTTDGYVKHTLVTQVEGVSFSSMDSNPATPNGYTGHHSSMTPMSGGLALAQSPLGAMAGGQFSSGMDEMDLDDSNLGNIDNIDVGKLLGLPDDFMDPAPPANF